MGALNITYDGLAISFLLLIIPLVFNYYFKLNLLKDLSVSVFRMTVQLILIGLFLKYLFTLNNPFVNVAWILVMILVAVLSTVKNSDLKAGRIVFPAFVSFAVVTFFIVLFLNGFVLQIQNVFEAKYLIILAGMLLGNSLRGNIVGISSFYKDIRNENKRFLYTLSLGASLHESVMPYLRNAVQLALRPTFASMSTVGIVALPGMMTGVILGGADLQVAVKYQIMIMLAIAVSTISSVLLTILFTFKISFTKAGILKEDIFR